MANNKTISLPPIGVQIFEAMKSNPETYRIVEQSFGERLNYQLIELQVNTMFRGLKGISFDIIEIFIENGLLNEEGEAWIGKGGNILRGYNLSERAIMMEKTE